MTERVGGKFDDQISIYNWLDRETHNLNICVPLSPIKFHIHITWTFHISKCETISSNVNIITHKMIVELSANNFAIILNQIERTNIVLCTGIAAIDEENSFLFLFQLPATWELFSFHFFLVLKIALRDFNIKCEMKLKCQCIKRFPNFFIFSLIDCYKKVFLWMENYWWSLKSF